MSSEKIEEKKGMQRESNECKLCFYMDCTPFPGSRIMAYMGPGSKALLQILSRVNKV